MQLICPSCRTPLPPAAGSAVVTCSACSAEVDLSRAGTAAGRPRFVPEVDRTGDAVGGWTLEARIGAGGMGTVYRARKKTQVVALKFLSPALAGEPEIVKRFRREVKLLEKLDHPAIVRVLEDGEEQAVPWFAMELVDGHDLKARLASGPLTGEEAGRVFGRLLEALAHAHSRGVVHRDLKPANVLLAADGAKLADFGIARPDADLLTGQTRLTETAAVLGTFPYMSPEQRAGATVDRRSDLFSVGVMLYEALTGRLPQGSFAPASEAGAKVPARVDGVLSRLMRPDPASRYDSASEARLALQAALKPRPSLRPVIAGGVATAALLGVVVPAALRNPGSFKSLPPSATPKATAPLQQVLGAKDPGQNAFDGPALANTGKNDNANIAFNENAAVQKVQQQAQQQVKATRIAGVPMTATCDPTRVYEKPTIDAPLVVSLPRGSALAKLKAIRSYGNTKSELERMIDFGIGRGAGLPALLAEAASKKASAQAFTDDQPQQQAQPPQLLEEELKKAKAAPPMVTWLYVSLEDGRTGWVEGDCAQGLPTPKSKPVFPAAK